MKRFKETEETHVQGHISLELENLKLLTVDELQDADLGLQISYDGRVWICINGLALLRFKPKHI